MKYITFINSFLRGYKAQVCKWSPYSTQFFRIIYTDHCFLQETTPVTCTGAESLKNKSCKGKASSSYSRRSNAKGKETAFVNSGEDSPPDDC